MQGVIYETPIGFMIRVDVYERGFYKHYSKQKAIREYRVAHGLVGKHIHWDERAYGMEVTKCCK